jgi:preprotein translocase subunit SecD
VKEKVDAKKTVGLLVVIALLAFCAYVLIHGIGVGIYDVGDIGNRMHYGLDLTGGVNVVLQAKSTDGNTVDSDSMDSTVSAIKNRVDSLGVSEASVTKQGDDRIRVSIPSIQDQQRALDMIGKTAKLEFLAPDGTVLLTGDDVSDSKAVKQKNSSGVEESVVTLVFNDDGTKKFADATTKYLNQTITIKLDDQVISAPTVNSAITNGQAIIEGMSDYDEASQLAELIRGGALPLELEPIQVSTIGPTLGQDSLQQSIFAGAIGIAAVLAFMLIFYRGLGFIADLALIVYVMLDLWIMVEMNVTLTLPGIAGMILSVGMAVDANVIIFERIKEESRDAGRSLEASIDAGFKRAMATIIDSNITTIIAGFVLFFLGSGTVQGFALTLVLGIVLSMLTAVVVTRQLIKLVLGTHLISSTKFYGV